MKKILFLLVTSVMVLTSCEGPAGRDGLDGKDFEFYYDYFTIKSQDWDRVSVGQYATLYEYVVDIKIGHDAYEKGLVLVYMFQWEGNNEVKTPLPHWVQHSQGNNTWLEGYNYDFDAGTIKFYAECRNGTNPPECEFHVVVAP